MDPGAIKDRDRCRLLNPATAPDDGKTWSAGAYGRLRGHWVHCLPSLYDLWSHGRVFRTCCNQIHGLFMTQGTWDTVFLGNNEVEARASIPSLRESLNDLQTSSKPKTSPRKWMKLPKSGAITQSLLQSDRFALRGWLLDLTKKDVDLITHYDILPFPAETVDYILNHLSYQRMKERMALGWEVIHHALEPCSVCDKLLAIRTDANGEIRRSGEFFFIFSFSLNVSNVGNVFLVSSLQFVGLPKQTKTACMKDIFSFHH